MKATRYLLLAAALGSGCNNSGTALIIEGTLLPSDNMVCKYDPASTLFQGYTQFDPFGQPGMAVALKVQNNLQPVTINIGSQAYPDMYMAPTEVVPVRMDVAFECDSEGFSSEVGPLFLPQFSAAQPFCQNRASKNFQGRDVVQASGPAIPAGTSGVAFVTIIPAELGQAFADLFNLAQAAQKCCNSTMATCSDMDLMATNHGPGTPCGDLQAKFDEIAGQNKLSAISSADIQKFLPWGLYDANVVKPAHGAFPPTYPIRVRGVLEAVTGEGTVYRSTEWTDVVHLCAHCGDPSMMPSKPANGSTPCSNFGP